MDSGEEANSKYKRDMVVPVNIPDERREDDRGASYVAL